jgi:L-alanine-DL-glutamate epimerase-like enolase superfamily enzyme
MLDVLGKHLEVPVAALLGEGQQRLRLGEDVIRRLAKRVERVGAAREAIGARAELFVDANGAYSRKEASKKAAAFSDFGVTWFEEPVSSDDLEGLRLLRDRAPAGRRGFGCPPCRTS